MILTQSIAHDRGQGVEVIARAGVHWKPGRLVNRQQVLVLDDHRVLPDHRRFRWCGPVQHKDFSRPHAVGRAYQRLSCARTHMPLIDDLLHAYP